MNEPDARSYSILGLKPGSSWNEIRKTYQTLINKWHPDRFQQDSKKQRVAEEKTREITRAYKTLADYYREHGSTPTYPPSPATTPARPPETTTPSEHMDRASAPASASTGNAHAGDPVPIPAEAARWKTLLILTAMALLLYLWLSDDPDRDSGAGALPKHAQQNEPRPVVDDKAASRPVDRFFTRGSKLGEVYEIQGIPSKTEDGVWHYGKSRVYFINGGVSHWDSHPDDPLHASLDVDPVITKKAYIERGSTKEEVRTLQGTPWRQTEREWAYGSSRIFFTGDVVTGWEESSLNPLKIQR
jgi:hypothetical protein